jgi:23S rRNA (cytosine1962-C5)-methyltransferase
MMSYTHDPEASGQGDHNNGNTPLAGLIERAISRRRPLIERLHKEDTDTYRIFHGTVEGRHGLTIDRYGLQVMVQTFHEPLAPGELSLIEQCLKESLGFDPLMVYHDRSSQKGSAGSRQRSTFAETPCTCREMGVQYTVQAFHRGQDPLLFLDLRAARRYMLGASRDKAVLNLFAYTCGIGLCAALGGAEHVINVDFSSSHLEFGIKNAGLNGIPEQKMTFINEDVFPVLRQFAGLAIKGRGRRRSYKKLAPRQFDLVVMDPPRWAKSAFGAVDLVRDYQSIFKPAVLATKPGGKILCTNHVPQVDLDDWLGVLQRCAAKAGRPLKDTRIIQPEEDFPAKDDRHPLKIALVEV